MIGFVVGTPRSGSTLLARVIDSHPDARCLIEPDLKLRRDGSYEAGGEEVDETPLSRLSGRSGLHCFKETFRASQLENSYRNVLSSKAYVQGCDRALAIVRDPRAVWNSARDRWGDDPQITKELYTRLWLAFTGFVSHFDVPVVRYEGLVEGNTGDVFGPLGLEPIPCEELSEHDGSGCGDERAMSSKRILKDSRDRWKSSLPADHVRYIERACGRRMSSYCYALQN